MNPRASIGVTLLDTIIVVSITAMFAVLAFPSFTSNDTYELDLAKNEIVSAIRFARSEALRTGDTYGVDIDRSSKQITIYKADLAANPVGQEFIAYHPITKDLYDYNLNNDFDLTNIEITNTTEPFLFADSIRRKSLLFTSKGMPVWIDTTSGAISQLQIGNVELSIGSLSKNITVDAFSGKVTAL